MTTQRPICLCGQHGKKQACVPIRPSCRSRESKLERTGNQESRLGEVFTLRCRGLERLIVDPAFGRPGPGAVGDSARE